MEKQAHQQAYDTRYDGDYMDADAYSTWVHEGLAARRVRETLEQVPLQPLKVLDYGCGQGKWSSLLRSVFPAAEIHGIDISSVAVEKAARKHPDCHFSAFDGELSPFADASFDLVFSFHVLEHVLDVETSVRDIARLIVPGGFACIIFPCGNRGSFEDRLVSLMKNGREPSPTGETIFFFEKNEGHLRRMESEKTIAMFASQGLALERELYSGQYFAALDWLVRGTGPHYINGLFSSALPRNRWAAVRLKLMHRGLLGLYRFIGFKDIDLGRKRSPLKHQAARFVRAAAASVDQGLMRLARWEWRHRRNNRAGSVQYLVMRKLDR